MVENVPLVGGALSKRFELDKLGYKYTKLSDVEAEGLLELPDKFVKTFVVDWYEKETRAWATYKKGG